MRTFLSPPCMNGDAERKLVAEAFASNYIAPCGPLVDAFEREAAARFGFEATLATVSGTMALELAARALGIGPGDTVIASDLTFIASVGPFVTLGAKPVFVGSDPETWTMSPALLERALTDYPKAKAVVATDLYGQCCDMEALLKVCGRFGVPLIADAAESVGATCRGKASGKGALLAVYSFNGNKIITSGGGGMLLSDDAGLLARCRKLAQQAREPVPWYEHTAVGTHGRLGNVPAAIGLAQLRHLDDALRDKARVWDLWGDVLAGRDWIRRMPTAPYGVPNRWLTVVTLDGVDPLAAVKVLADAGIESRPLWKPMRLQPVFRGAPVYGTALEENLFAHGLCLPSGRTLDRETVMTVAGLIDKLRG